LFTKAGKQQLCSAEMSPVMAQQRDQWLTILETFDQRILETMLWLKQQSQDDQRITRLRTHPGIGLLTSLGLVHTLWPVSRFRNQRKVTAYAGLEPMERSSAERKKFLGISKAGSRLLRYLVIEAAHTAVKKDDSLKCFYRRLEERRGRPKAKVAVARKLLVRSYIMLRDEIDYAEFQQRAVAARLARQSTRQTMPVSLIGQPASAPRQERATETISNRGSED
jgi:transposase